MIVTEISTNKKCGELCFSYKREKHGEGEHADDNGEAYRGGDLYAIESDNHLDAYEDKDQADAILEVLEVLRYGSKGEV